MKLAEALSLRADLQKRIAQLESRLINNATMQEGESPVEDPNHLLMELDSLTSQLEGLMSMINITNCNTIKNEKSITQMIAKRDALTIKVNCLRQFLFSASNISSRAMLTEIRVQSTVNVGELQKKVDQISKEIRETDMRIQELNWATELKEL
jgi:hypothetical protein